MKKSTSCSLTAKLLAISLAIVGWTASSLSASATEFVFDMVHHEDTDEPGESAYVAIQVTVEQMAAGGSNPYDYLQFTIDQTDTATSFGDLRGLLFHVNEEIIDPTLLDFSFVSAVDNSGTSYSAPLSPDDDFLSASTGINSESLDGLKNYDVLVNIGTPGETPDDLRTITFDVALTGGALDLFSFMPVYMNKFMAVRLTSVWVTPDSLTDREYSSKGICCGTEVPEPSSTMGLLAFAIGGLLWRRRVLS